MTTRDRIRVIRRAIDEHIVEDRGYDTPCWIWVGCTSRKQGYARIAAQGTVMNVSRALLIALERLRKGEYACHHCDQTACVKPSHLWSGTQSDNVKDSFAKGRSKGGDRPDNRRSTHPMAKLSEENVARIRDLVSQGTKQKDLAKEYRVSPQQISKIIRKVQW